MREWNFPDRVFQRSEREGTGARRASGDQQARPRSISTISSVQREGRAGVISTLQGAGSVRRRCVSSGLGIRTNSAEDCISSLSPKGYGDDRLPESGLFNVDERHGMYDKFLEPCVIFPIMDVNNRVIGFGGRVCDG